MSNRVEDLERQVAELQAAVNGLTEELVEMKERVRQVEDANEVSVAADAGGSSDAARDATESADDQADAEATGGTRRTHSDDHVEVVEQTGDAGNAGGDDMVVPEQEATTPDAAAGDPEEAEAEGDDEESDSDIIVA